MLLVSLIIEGKQKLLDFTYLESEVVPRIATEWFNIGLFLEIPSYGLNSSPTLVAASVLKCLING